MTFGALILPSFVLAANTLFTWKMKTKSSPKMWKPSKVMKNQVKSFSLKIVKTLTRKHGDFHETGELLVLL